MQQRQLDGKVAIVTGARTGIGRAEAEALAAAGAKVVACDIVFDDEMAEVSARIVAAGGECLALQCDVRDRAQIQHVVDAAVREFGRIDVLVNNAQGGLDPCDWEQITDELIETSLYSGPIASLRFMQACLPHMKTQGSGRIINTASAASRGGVPDYGHYAMAKGAIASLTYAAATDWGKFGITVNVIYPMILTASLKEWIEANPEERSNILATRIPMGYMGDPADDLAPVIVFIASDASRYLTGHPFFIDGGAAHAPR